MKDSKTCVCAYVSVCLVGGWVIILTDSFKFVCLPLCVCLVQHVLHLVVSD